MVSVLAYVLFVSSWSRVGMQAAASALQRQLLCRLVSAVGHRHRAHSHLGEKLLGPGAGFGPTAREVTESRSSRRGTSSGQRCGVGCAGTGLGQL